MAKKKSYHTIDELLEQQRQNAFSNFSVGDNKEYHTIDEIKKAATEQGLLTERAPATQPSAQTTSGRRNLMIRNNQIKNDSRQWKQNQVDGSNPFDLRNQVYKTQNETIPRIAQQAASDYVKNRMGYNYISQYGDDTRYSDVSNDINRVQQLKGGAARRGKDTEVYDRALEMLKGYSQRYRLDDTDTSPEAVKDRENLYNDNKREISRLNSQLEAEKGGSLNQALRQWLDSYDDNGIITDEDNQYYIDEIKKNTGYDISQYVGGLDSQKRSEKAEQLRATLGEDTSVNDRKSLESQLDFLNTQNRKYERYQKPIDDYQDVRNDPDFSETSFSDIANSDRRDKLSLYSNSHNEEFNNSYDDPVALSNIVAEGDVNGWGTLTNSEKDIYYHLLDTQGEEAAYKYLDDMNLVLQKRETGYAEEQARDVASARPLGIPIGGLASVPGKMIGGALAFADDALHTITGEEINPYDPAHRLANETAAVMESDVDYINDKTNNWNIGGFTLGDAYQALASAEEMGLGIGMGTAAYSALMSMDAAQSKAKQLYDSGASNEVIATESLASGAFEYVFEKVSLDMITNKIISGMLTKESAARYITAALMSAGVEGSEEVATEAANYVADIIIRKEQSERQTLIKDYLAQGYSQEEAEKRATDAFKEDLYKSFMGGALAGAIGGGYFGGAYNSVKSNIQERSERNQYIRNVGNDVTGAGNAQALLDRAAQIDDPAVKAQVQRTQQALDKANQNSTKTTNNRLSRETGKLYAAMQDSTAQGIQNAEANEIKAAIKSAYAAETGETDSSVISKAADAIYKSEYTDERLTRSERNLAETAAAQSAIESVKNNPDLIESATQKAQERGFRDYVETAKLTQKQETKTDDDVDIDEFNYHEDDGKVYTSDGKKQVDIASVASIGDNDITFELSDGQTESAKALDMPTNQAVLAQSILDVQKKIGVPLTADIANTLYQGYEQSDSPSVSAYMQDAQTVLFNGYANNTAPDSSIKLPQELRNQLYSMGRQLAASHTQAQQQNVNARVKGNKSRKGTVTFQDGINRNRLDPRRRTGVDAVEHLAQSLGFDVVFYRSTKDGKGRFSSEYVRKNKFVADGQQAPSGFWRGGKMYLDINAGMNGEGLILFTASHELVHMIREGSPEDFKALSDFLVQNYAEQGVDINDLVRKEMARSTNLTRDQALEEVIAESCETFLRDTTLNDKAQELYKQNPTLWSRIREALKRIVDAVKQWYSVARPQSEEARITMRASVETLENAYDLWTKGIIKSAENLRNTERESTDTKYQGRAESQDTEYLDAVERGDMETAQRMVDEAAKAAGYTVKGYHQTARDFTVFNTDNPKAGLNDSETPNGIFFKTNDHDIGLEGKKQMAGYLNVGNVLDFNDRAEANKWYRKNVEGYEALDVAMKDEVKRIEEKMNAIERDMFRDGITDEEYETLDSEWNKLLEEMRGIENEYRGELRALLNDYFLKDSSGYDSIHLGYDGHRYVDGKRENVETYIVFKNTQVKSADPVTYDDNGDVIPLSERFNESNNDIRYQARINVNNSPEFKKWFGDSHVVNDSNRPLVVYHQTNNDFTVFDTEHEGAGRNDDETPYGVFLKPNDNNIGLAGNKQMPLYASIQNPLYADRRVDLVQHYSKNIPEYSSKKAALNDIDREYMDRLEKAREEEDRQYRELWQKRRDGEITNSQFHDAIENMDSNRILEEWSEASNKASRELKRIVTDYLRNSEYDGVIIQFDEGSFGRTTKTFIALDNTQVKSATENVGTFDGSNPDIRYQSRDDDLFSTDDMFDDDSISSTVAREYITHHEDIGEVLKNIADIDLPSSKVQSIVNRVIRNELGYLDEEARRTLSIELQLALERVSKTDAQDVSNEMINAVRKAVEGARITDERTQASYQELRNVFKGKKFYLTDEQINQLKEHDMTFDDFRKAMFGKVTIVKRENAKRSINGGYADAQQLSLEGLHDVLDNPEEVLGIRRDEWDNKNYDAPYIIKNAFDTLREQQSQLVTDMYSDEAIDDMAIAIAAKITGDIVEAKYNSRKNPYVSKLVKDLQAKRTEAVNKQKERNKQKLAELKTKERERAEKREQDLKKKYQEQRDRNREGRKRTELRGKIRKLTDSLQRRLTAPKGKQYVPRELISQTVDVLNAVNLDSGRSTRLSEKLAALRNEYDKLKEREESYAMYDGVISNMLLGLSDSVGNTPIMNMTLSQLKQVYDVIRSMDYVIRESVKMTDTNFKKETHQIGRDWIAEIKAVPKEHVGLLSGYVQTMLSAERFFNRIAGFKKNSTSSQLFDMLNKGQLAQTQYEMEFTQIFADLIQDKQLKSLYDTKNLVDIGLEDEDGNKVPITRGMMLSLYMHLLNEDNTRHVMGGGLTVPNMKDYYKGDVKKAFGNGMKSVRVGALDYSQYAEGIKSVIERQLTEYEIKWIEAAQEFFDGASRKALNETTMKLYGFRRANVNNYFPIHTDSNYRAPSFESITRDMSLENSGFMKERVKASNPIYLEDIVDVINDQISKVAKYCGMTLPIRNFQKVYGTTTHDFESSVQRELNRKFSASSKNTGAIKYIDNLLTDLTSGRSTDEGFIARMMGRARGNLAQATLTLNPRVAIAQAASYPTAAAVIGWEPLFKALRKGGKNNTVFSRADREAIAEISPLLWKRTQGYSNVEIGDIKELRKQRHQVEGKLKKAMGWIEFFDGMTVGRLFYACQYYVDEQNPELKRGTAEYNAKVADVYNKVIERTQPNYTTLQRPDILRNPNALIKSLSMFMTQRLQNFNIVYDAAGTYNRYLKDYKKGLNGVTAEDVKGARTTLIRSVTSQLVAAGTIVGMKLFADVLLHSMNAYRDDDDELTAESVSLKLLDNFADTLFGSVLFGSDLYSLVKSAISGSRYYGISLSGVDSLVDAVTNIVNLRKGITLDSANKSATSVCQLFGIPLNNAEKIGKAIYYWSSDISGGEAFESGVNRTIKQNLHRYETRLNSGEADKANELLTAMLDDKMSQGKTEKEAKSWLRGRFTATYKQRYIDAMNSKDTEEVKNIREILLSTGLYGSLSEQDKTLKKWLE